MVRSSATPVPALDLVLVGSDDGNLYALNAVDGSQNWMFPIGAPVRTSPAVGEDGTIYVGSDDGNLYAVKSNGTLKWVLALGPMVRSSPVVGSDGAIYVGSDNGKFCRVKKNGNPGWSIATGGAISSSPAAGANVIYVGSASQKIYAFYVKLPPEIR